MRGQLFNILLYLIPSVSALAVQHRMRNNRFVSAEICGKEVAVTYTRCDKGKAVALLNSLSTMPGLRH
jgi:hypothetical protein